MASLVHAIESFRSGSLDTQGLIAAVDQILAGERVNESWLLETLDEENTRAPLPGGVHQQVRQRIEQAAEHKRQVPATGGASAAAKPLSEDQATSATRLATSLPPQGSWPSRPGGGSMPDNAATRVAPPELLQPEAMKGTGDTLNDRFVLEACIGAGGMSTVYKALDRRKLEADDRNPYVAVKVLNVEFRAHPDSLIALQREAKKSQSLAHPNIVRVYDFDRDGSTVYMTMEYLSGKSLAKVLRAPGFEGLDESVALRILEDVSRALIFAHESGIVHSDFKPANIILTDNGKVKVIDFGIARAFQRPDESDAEATRFDPGSLGALTPTYASPEMLEHGDPDPRDDVYALACITYEMLTGRHPFGRMQATEARDGGLALQRRNLSRRQFRALKAALAFDRDKRTPTIREFLSAMRPESRVPFSVPLKIVAQAAAIAGVGISAYLLAVSGWLDFSGEGREAPALAEDRETDKSSVELATLQPEPRTATNKGAGAPQPQAVAASRPAREAAQVPVTAPPTKTLAAVSAVNSAPPKQTERPQAPARPLKENVAAIVGDLSCAAINTSVNNGVVNLRGYVSRALDVSALEQRLAKLAGARQVTTDLKAVDKDKCAVIDLFAPYWAIHREAGSRASISVKGKDNELTEGDALVLDISTPARQSFVNVDYFALDGGVVHMLPSPRAANNLAPPNYKATLGDLGEWTIAEPFGREMVTVITTPKPLFETSRDEYEKHADYLAALRERLDQISRDSGKDSVAVDFVMINTRPKARTR